jgi:chloramphenicol 3-O-phosphotransferase
MRVEIPGEVLAIAGPSAAGKTTVARLLADSSATPSVHLQADAFFTSLRVGRMRAWESGSELQHELVYSIVGSVANAWAGAGYAVVIDGVVHRQSLEPLIGAILESGRKVHIAILRPDLATVERRSAGRPEADRHAPDILRWQYTGYHERYAGMERYFVDNSELSPEATAVAIVDALACGALRHQ